MENLVAAAELLAREQTHGAHVVQTELAGPVELCLVGKVAYRLFVVHRAVLNGPHHTLLEVEVVVALKRLAVGGLARHRVDVLALGVVEEVVDTAAGLYEVVIPGHHAVEVEAGGDEVEFLVQREVGVDAGRHVGLHTGEGQVLG